MGKVSGKYKLKKMRGIGLGPFLTYVENIGSLPDCSLLLSMSVCLFVCLYVCMYFLSGGGVPCETGGNALRKI